MISVGVLTPHAAAGPEVELPEMAPGQVVAKLSRITTSDGTGSALDAPPTSPSGLRALTATPAIDKAAAVFADGSVDVIAYASTSTAYAIGFEAETTMVERISQRLALPATGASLAAVAALQSLDVHRVALVHPPWFDDETNDLGAAYFRDQGFEVVSSESAELDNDPSRIAPKAVVAWISGHIGDRAEAVFIGGTGFRASRAIATLEEQLGRPVLESNQVLLWSILATVDADLEVTGYGRLLGPRR